MNIKEEIRTYWDSRYINYDNSPGHCPRSKEEKNEWISTLKRNVDLENNSKILDVGTGTGFLALSLAGLGYDVVGIDLSEKMLSKAIKKAESDVINVEFRIGDAEKTQFNDKSFDAVISRHLLWTLPNPRKAIEEWNRILKPKGKVLIIDGEWSSKDGSISFKKFIGQLLMLIQEGRNPWKWKKHQQKIKNKLPFNGGAPSGEIESLLNKNGFSNIWKDNLSELVEVERKNAPYYYKMMHTKSRYLIGGKKK